MERGVVQSYQDLRVWQEGMNLAEMCYRVTRQFPKEELYGMTSQIRRACASVPANIAEGYGRGSRGQYLYFLYVAQGSLKELETHLILSKRIELISPQTLDPALKQCESVGKLLRALIYSLKAKSKH